MVGVRPQNTPLATPRAVCSGLCGLLKSGTITR
jgi:hypothetical protein